MQLLRSLLFTTFFFAGTLAFAAVVIACAPFSRWHPWWIVPIWARAQLGALKLLCGLGYVVEGAENIPPGNHIAMWKHSSAFEAVAQGLVIPPQAWVLKRELMWVPLLGWAVHFMRPIAIDRKAGGSAVSQVVAQGKQRLADGLWISIFPEGTRTAPGQTRRYGISGALLASQTGKWIVPVAHDAGDYWPRRALLKKPGTIRVVVGPPIANTLGRDPQDINAQVQAWVETKVAEIRAAHAERAA
jgi:1-acyl-sn-glycerol-3-phosphate acyltransferase